MTTRRVDYLITDVRSSTENQDFSDNIGIGDDEFLRYINDAQFRIQSLITQQHPNIFLTESIIDVVNNQESYTLPTDIYMGNKVVQLEYSITGGADDYYPLRADVLRNRTSAGKGSPDFYIRKGGKFLVHPVPTSGTFRITYVHRLPRLDIMRGEVSAVVLDNVTKTITSLAFNVSTSTVDTTELGKSLRLSIVDTEGNVQMKNIKFDTINASTGDVTINSSFTFSEGEVISVGDKAVGGQNSSTHSQLDEMVERYLIAYATMKILERDSSSDIQVQSSILGQMERDIVAAYAELDDDINEIPDILDSESQWEIF